MWTQKHTCIASTTDTEYTLDLVTILSKSILGLSGRWSAVKWTICKMSLVKWRGSNVVNPLLSI